MNFRYNVDEPYFDDEPSDIHEWDGECAGKGQDKVDAMRAWKSINQLKWDTYCRRSGCDDSNDEPWIYEEEKLVNQRIEQETWWRIQEGKWVSVIHRIEQNVG